MRGELNLVGLEMKLFEEFARVAMAEDGVRGEVVGGVHEVGFFTWSLACSADARLGIADDAVFHINEAGLEQRREREDDGGCVAPGISDKTSLADLVAMELGAAIDRFCLQVCCALGVSILKAVDGAIGLIFEAPGSAEVDDSNAMLYRERSPLPGLFVWSRQKQDFDPGVDNAVPTEGDDLVRVAIAVGGELRMEVFEPDRDFSLCFSGAAEEGKLGAVESGMM